MQVKMSMKQEVILAKIVATVIIVLTLAQITRADERIADLFQRYHAPEGLTAIVESAGDKHGIDPKIIAAIIVIESSAKTKAVSKSGDYGLMQVRWKVHKKDIQRQYPYIKTAEGLLDPTVNINIGTELFARYLSQKKTLHEALIRYSGGNCKMANKVLKVLEDLRR